MNQCLNIIIAGVGGQGTVLASRVLAQVALNHQLPARTAETIGMAQREGTVQSHVRIGNEDFSPIISQGQADILLGFEPAEAVRASGLLKPSGLMLVNLYPIRPITVTLGTAGYPMEQIQSYLEKLPVNIRLVKAFETAVAAGSFRVVNTVMLGALAATGVLPFSQEEVLEVLLDYVPQRVRDINKRGFELGLEVCSIMN